jgi:putative transcriptional regulator
LIDLPDQDSEMNRINLALTESALPLALQRHEPTRWRQFGQIRRGRIPSLSEGKIRANLMEIEPNSQIPQHKHKGYELTLLLAGEFSDEQGNYQVGDFLYLDQTEIHSPITKTGCLCYTVSNAPLYFTQGVNQWLNPLGYFLY